MRREAAARASFGDRPHQPLLAAALSALMLVLSGTGLAATDVTGLYWVSDGHGSLFPGTVGRQALAGGVLETLHTFPIAQAGLPLDMEVDPTGRKLYWADAGNGIRRMDLSGGAPETIVPFDGAWGMALDLADGKIYWCTLSAIHRSNLDGSVQEVYAGIGGRDVDVDPMNRMIYLVNSEAILRQPLGGGGFTTVVSGSVAEARTLELDPANNLMFWTTPGILDGEVRRSPLTGTGVQTILTEVGSAVEQLSVDPVNQRLYIAALEIDFDSNRIAVADYDGTNLSTFAAADELVDVQAIDIGPMPGPCAAPDGENLTLSDSTVLDTQTYEVCGTLEVGPNYQVMGPNGHLTLRAESKVVLKNSTSVGVDGTLIVENGPLP